MIFPLYRKYSHERTYFKIVSTNGFEELNIIGKSFILRNFEVKIFTDRIFISDMMENKENLWVEIGAEEYEAKKNYCLANLQMLSQ
ncbi:MAG: hypothetical protein K2X86_16690 [Cytophagaceae bacterium]|nr:hypothetical protein [Cytophagaceae bacterium]